MTKPTHFLLLIIIALTSTGLAFCDNATSKKSSTNQDLWYVGGTLHSSTLSEWRNATPKNKLATCADFAANIKKSNGQSYNGDIVLMKKDANELMDCIENAIVEQKEGAMKISDVAVLCAMTGNR